MLAGVRFLRILARVFLIGAISLSAVRADGPDLSKRTVQVPAAVDIVRGGSAAQGAILGRTSVRLHATARWSSAGPALTSSATAIPAPGAGGTILPSRCALASIAAADSLPVRGPPSAV